jgi:hypothetical protein
VGESCLHGRLPVGSSGNDSRYFGDFVHAEQGASLVNVRTADDHHDVIDCEGLRDPSRGVHHHGHAGKGDKRFG